MTIAPVDFVERADTAESALPIVDGHFLGELATLARSRGSRQRAAAKMLSNLAAQERVVRAIVAGIRHTVISTEDFSLMDAVEFLRVPLTAAVEVLVELLERDASNVDVRFLDYLSWEATHRRPWVDGRPSEARGAIKLLRANPAAETAVAQFLERRLRSNVVGPDAFTTLRLIEVAPPPSPELMIAIADVVLSQKNGELLDLGLGAIHAIARRNVKVPLRVVRAISGLLDISAVNPTRDHALEVLAAAGPLPAISLDVLRQRMHAMLDTRARAGGRVVARDAAVASAYLGFDDELTLYKIRLIDNEFLPEHRLAIIRGFRAARSCSPAIIELLHVLATDRAEEVSALARATLNHLGMRTGVVRGWVRRLLGSESL